MNATFANFDELNYLNHKLHDIHVQVNYHIYANGTWGISILAPSAPNFFIES